MTRSSNPKAPGTEELVKESVKGLHHEAGGNKRDPDPMTYNKKTPHTKHYQHDSDQISPL